ncbi:hypothetical protein KC330_g7494 [Hortaea werneckii]|nr:hypothetical protein KC330_g7494 [Hortaea werneckii]
MLTPLLNDTNDFLTLYTRVASAKTSFALLNFPPTSHPSDSELRFAYKTLALVLHPDKAPLGRQELHTALFQKVHAAFQELSNPLPKEAREAHHAAAGGEEEGGRRRSNVPLRRIEDCLHARVHDFREWLKTQRSAELAERKKAKKISKGYSHGHDAGVSEGWEDPDVVVEGKKDSVLAGSNACVARSAQIQREEDKKKSRFLEGAGSTVRAEKRLDRLYASGTISTREYERAWMALDDMPGQEEEEEEEVQGFVDQEPELCEMLGIRTSDPPPPAGTEAGQRLIANAVDAEELSEGVAANLELLLVEAAPSRSGQKAICRGKKSQAVDSWEEEEDRLAASVSGE